MYLWRHLKNSQAIRWCEFWIQPHLNLKRFTYMRVNLRWEIMTWLEVAARYWLHLQDTVKWKPVLRIPSCINVCFAIQSLIIRVLSFVLLTTGWQAKNQSIATQFLRSKSDNGWWLNHHRKTGKQKCFYFLIEKQIFHLSALTHYKLFSECMLHQCLFPGNLPSAISGLASYLTITSNPNMCGLTPAFPGLNETGTGLGAACPSPPCKLDFVSQ